MAASSSSSRLVRAVGRSLFSGLCNNADGLMRSTHEMMCNHLLFQETQIQVTMYGKDITHYEREFVPFQTYLLSMAYVTESTKAYGNPLHELTWTIGKGTIVEPIEQVIPPEPPLLPPTLLKVTSFDSFDYQAIGFKFDILALVINGSPPSYASNGSKIHHHRLSEKTNKTHSLGRIHRPIWE